MSDESDPLLVVLVDIVNGSSTRIPITLLIGGTFLSGELIGGNIFMDNMAEDFGRSILDEEVRTNVTSAFRNLGLEWYGRDDDATDDEIHFLHLADAQTWGPEVPPFPTAGTFWRGRLDAVDGWVLGRLEAGEPSS